VNRVNFRDGFGHDGSTVDIVIDIIIIKLSLKTIIPLRLDHIKENKGGDALCPEAPTFVFAYWGELGYAPSPADWESGGAS